jgi:hypothetical protein
MLVPKFVRGLACAIAFASPVDSCVTPDTRGFMYEARASLVALEEANLGARSRARSYDSFSTAFEIPSSAGSILKPLFVHK